MISAAADFIIGTILTALNESLSDMKKKVVRIGSKLALFVLEYRVSGVGAGWSFEM